MDSRIVQFISALRARGVRISLAESVDAFKAVEEMGVNDRNSFRVALRASLVKESDDLPVFDELFPIFFTANEPPRMFNPSEELTPSEARMIADALRQFTDKLRKALEKMLEGRPLTPEELNDLAQHINFEAMADPQYQEWLSKRMEQAMQFDEVKKALEELAQMLAQMGMDQQRLEQLMQMMEANAGAMQEQMRQYAGQRIAEKLSEQEQRHRADALYNRPFESLSDEDMLILRKEVNRLAAALRTRLALRLKRARTGQLDVKATLRANLKHGNVPIELRHRNHTLKPKIVVLCDLSTSMRHVSEMMLSFLYAIQDQISKTHAFAYIDHLEYISEFFHGSEPQAAVTTILKKMPSGHYNTDFGFSLENFTREYMDMVDRRTTFIVVGDGRNNYNQPNIELFKEVVRRSRNSIWLNPEAMTLWGRGDSDMLKYAPLVNRVFQVSNLSQLHEAVDHMLLGGG
ncbi:MAG TPA: VWA domain-containing protein [Anaerolineaceae bacterium]|nr:VWA domain-containing protein [Anaerolineaceae bacterium]